MKGTAPYLLHQKRPKRDEIRAVVPSSCAVQRCNKLKARLVAGSSDTMMWYSDDARCALVLVGSLNRLPWSALVGQSRLSRRL